MVLWPCFRLLRSLCVVAMGVVAKNHNSPLGIILPPRPQPPSRPRLSLALGISPLPDAHGFHGLNRGKLWFLRTAPSRPRRNYPPLHISGYFSLKHRVITWFMSRTWTGANLFAVFRTKSKEYPVRSLSNHVFFHSNHSFATCLGHLFFLALQRRTWWYYEQTWLFRDGKIPKKFISHVYS